MSKLAINGGHQEVALSFQHFNHPTISENIISQMANIRFQDLVSSFDGYGAVANVERTFEKIMSVEHALATNSGTSALLSMYYALGLGEGDEVIVPAYTFFATAMPLFILGSRPVLADCLDNGNIDPADIRRRICSKTKAIVITHMWGIPCDMEEIMAIANEFDLPVLEDASHAHGATYRGKITGSFGKAAAWSLGAKKIVTGGQGGMFQSPNDEIYQRAFLLGSANNKVLNQITLDHLKPYSITGSGLNLRMHPFAAVLIDEQLKNLPTQIQERSEVAQFIKDGLNEIPGISFPRIPEGAQSSWYALTFLYDSTMFEDVPREAFVSALVAEGAKGADIPGTHCPLTEFQCFRDGKITFGDSSWSQPAHFKGEFHNAEHFHGSTIKLPVWYGPMRMEYASSYVNTITKVVENIGELREKVCANIGM